MSALFTLLLSHAKIVLVTVAVASTVTVASVVVSDTPASPDGADLSDDSVTLTVEQLTIAEADELLAEFTAACGPDAVAPDLTGMTEDAAEAVVEPLIEACEEAAEGVDEDAAEADELLAEFTAACGPDAVAPDLTGMTEDAAEAVVEPLVEACEEAAEPAEVDEDQVDEDHDAAEVEADDDEDHEAAETDDDEDHEEDD